MDRRDFVKLTGIGAAGLMLPITGRIVSGSEAAASRKWGVSRTSFNSPQITTLG